MSRVWGGLGSLPSLLRLCREQTRALLAPWLAIFDKGAQSFDTERLLASCRTPSPQGYLLRGSIHLAMRQTLQQRFREVQIPYYFGQARGYPIFAEPDVV